MIKTVQIGLKFNNPILIEDIENDIDPLLIPIIKKEFHYRNGLYFVNFNNEEF